MKKNEFSKDAIASYEANRKIRRDWNGINPATKIYPNKKKESQS